MEIGEAHALGCQLIEDGSFDGTTVTAEVTVAEVVDEQGDEVRTGGSAQGCGREEDKR